MVNMEHAFKRYLKDALGISVKPRKWPAAGQLPFFLRNLYAFFQATILNTPCLVMVCKGDEEQTPATISKHMDQIQKKWEHPIIYVHRRVSRYNRKRLIEHKAPFVVPGNQMYLPFLGIDLREYFKTIRNTGPKWSPSTQAAFLYALHHPGQSLTPKGLADQLRYTPMTMSRAFDELEAAGIGQTTMEGRLRTLFLGLDRAMLWDKAQTFLKSPVMKKVWVKGLPNSRLGVKAGLVALSHYSAIAPPVNPVFAVEKKEWKQIQALDSVMKLDLMEPEAFQLEIWSYSPGLFANKDGVADRLSLFLSLRGADDERIEMALEEMMRRMQW